jgi:penicillin-binding protein 1A
VKVLSEAVTAEETSILEQNVQSGTATRSAIACPTAAKTGTTEELVDAWLDGYTPDYSTAVWMGYPNRRVSMTDVHGEPQQGGYLPAEIWHAYMAAVTEGKPCVPFPASQEAISYEPFYGKYAATGLAQTGRKVESQSETPTPTRVRRRQRREAGSGRSERVTPVETHETHETHESHETHEPHGPSAPTEPPPEEKGGPNVTESGGAPAG